MIQHVQYKSLIGMVSVTCLFILPGMAYAQVSSPAVTFTNGLYHYDYSIANTTADELLLVTIQVLPFNDPVNANSPTNPNNPVFNVNAPAGFSSAYDPVNGFVSYLEDTSQFTLTPLSGFTYDSALAPMPSTFNSTFLTSTTSGTTLAAVPEPGSIALLGAMSAAGCFSMRKRRRNTESA